MLGRYSKLFLLIICVPDNNFFSNNLFKHFYVQFKTAFSPSFMFIYIFIISSKVFRLRVINIPIISIILGSSVNMLITYNLSSLHHTYLQDIRNLKEIFTLDFIK